MFPTSDSPSYSVLVLLINCLSLIRLSKPSRSNTWNQSPPDTIFKASITNELPPCVTAVDNWENFVLGFLWPVLSVNLYTAIVILGCPSNFGIATNLSLVVVPSTKGDLPLYISISLPAWQPYNVHPIKRAINILNISIS